MKALKSLLPVLLVLVFGGCNEDLPFAPEPGPSGATGEAETPGSDKAGRRIRWQEVAYLQHPENDGESFGNAVDLVRGRVMVGAPGASIQARRGAFIFEGARYVWDLEDSFSNSSAFYGYPGISVALSNEHAVMGCNSDETGLMYGSALTYRSWGDFWLDDDTLLPLNDHLPNAFSYDMDIDGDLLVVGAPNDVYIGAAYLYQYGADGDWNQLALLRADGPHSGDCFGWAVAVVDRDGFKRVAVGARGHEAVSGAVFIFKENIAGSWVQEQVLTCPDGAGIRFGESVAIFGKNLVVGDPANNTVYAFTYRGGQYRSVATLTPSDPASTGFGQDVDISSRRVIVGAPDGVQPVVYIFNSSSWAKDAMLAPSQTPDDDYGLSVAIKDRRAIVGTAGCGAYIYELFVFEH